MIAGLPQAPVRVQPVPQPEGGARAPQRGAAGDGAAGLHHQADYDQASQAAASASIRATSTTTIREPYFFDYVQQQLIDKYGVNTVRNGGLKVYTTIDPPFRRTPSARSTRARSCYSAAARQSALASIDPTNGHILAMASSQPTTATAQFNLAAEAHRQPGSSFKPFVLATAIRQGMDPDTTYYTGASPMTLTLADGTDLDGQQRRAAGGGTMNVREATIDSVNAVFAQLDLDVGPENVRQTGVRDGDHDPPRRLPGRGDRRSAPRGHAARAGGRLRDARRRRRPPHGDRDREGRVPERRHRHARRAEQHRGVLRRDRLRGDATS